MTALDDAPGSDPSRSSELRWIVDYNVTLFIRMLEDGAFDLDESAGAELVASAANRAAQGFSIENLLDSYVEGTSAVWQAVTALVDRDRSPDLDQVTEGLFQYLRAVLSLVARGFQLEASRVSAGAQDARYAVFSALISGADPVHVAGRAAIPLASRYLVIALRLGGSDEGGENAGGENAGGENAAARGTATKEARRAAEIPQRRRANEIRRILAEFGAGEVLALVGDPVGTALVPVRDESTTSDLAALGATLVDAMGTPVHIGATFASVDGIPDALEQSEQVLELVLALGFDPGVWTLDDVLVPFQLTRPGPARDALAARLRVLDDHADWEETVRAYLRFDGDRQRTAQHLHVHPNTVDYRLRRLAEAAGLDNGTQTFISVALPAIWVRDVIAGSAGERA